MAVTEQTPISTYTANGVATAFAFAFLAFEAGSLLVQTTDLTGVTVDAVLGVDYTVTGLGNPAGGSVTFSVAPANGYRVTVSRHSGLHRDTDYQDNGDLLSGTVNIDFDRLWLVLQEIYRGGGGLASALRVPIGEVVAALPNAAARANKTLGFDALGAPLLMLGGGGGGGGGGDVAALQAALADAANVANGDAMLAVKQPFAGSVARTQHDKNIDTGLYPEDFRLPADPNDTLSIQRILDLGQFCYLRPGKTYVAYGLKSKAGTGLVCLGGRATIDVPLAAGNTSGIWIDTGDFILDGVNFIGHETGPWNVTTPTGMANRFGVIVGKLFGTGSGVDGITVRNCDISGFNNSGLQGGEVQVGYNFGKHCTVDNVYCFDNYVNFWYGPRFEYVTTTNCSGYRGWAGIIMQAGNNNFSACQFEKNNENCQLPAGENDGHGTFVGCSFNHSWAGAGPGGYGLHAASIANGHVFIGCQWWFAPILLDTCTGIRISHSEIVSSPVTIVGGGLNMIDDNYVRDSLSRTFSGNTFTSFRRNRTKSTDNTVDEAFGDVYVRHKALTAGFPFALTTGGSAKKIPFSAYWNKYNGLDAAFLTPANGDVYIPRPGRYRVALNIVLNPGASGVVNLLIRRSLSGGGSEDVLNVAETLAAQRSFCLADTLLCENGDTLSAMYYVASATNVVSATFSVSSVD